jgi:HlyD family secretion protein
MARSASLLRSRSLRWTGGLVLLVLILVWAFRPAPVPVDLAPVQKGSLQVTVDEEGETRVRDRFIVSAPVPGQMRRIELEPGDSVSAGKTILAVFEPADPALLDSRTRAELQARARAAESSIGAARAERERLGADLEFARRELARYRPLFAAGAISRETLDTAERQVRTLEEAMRSAEFNVRTAQHQLEVARASLIQRPGGAGALIRLTSPVDGVVLRRLQESETVVTIGQALIEIGDLDQLEIVSDVLSTAAVRVRTGQPVLIEQWGGSTPLRGRVRRVDPSGFTKISALGVEEQRVNVVIDIEEPREVWQRLGDGYRVEVRIIVSQRDDVLKVPTSSLFRQGESWAVYRVAGSTANLQLVKVGLQNGLEAEIVSGLEAGRTVVVFPSDDVEDGVRVEPRQ